MLDRFIHKKYTLWLVVAAFVVAGVWLAVAIWYPRLFVTYHQIVTTQPLGVDEWRSPASVNTPVYWQSIRRLHSLGYDAIYLYLNTQSIQSNPTGYMSQLTAYIIQARKAGMQVAALGGDPSWISPSNNDQIVAFLHFIAAYNIQANYPLRDIEFDIEPYATQPQMNAEAVAGALKQVALRIHSDAAADNLQNLTMGYTIPFWMTCMSSVTACQTTSFLTTLSDAKQDFIVIMDYRNSTAGKNGSVALAKPFFHLVQERNLHVKIFLGQEVGPAQPTEVSFYGSSVIDFRLAQHNLDEAYSKNIAYRGEIVNSLAYLKTE